MTTMISDLFQAWLLGKLVATFICIVLLMSAWVTVQILLIAINVLRLSLDKNTRFYQSAKQRRDSYFAIGSIAVTFIVLVFMPALKAPQGSIAFMSAHVSIAILFGYNLMAITFYRGR